MGAHVKLARDSAPRAGHNGVMPAPDVSPGLPAPQDDGAADHLPGGGLPVTLPATGGGSVDLSALPRRTVVFVYPGIGGPDDEQLLADWTSIPGARGCTPEACGFRDLVAEFGAQAVDVFGLSAQGRAEQAAHVRKLDLPYLLLSDEQLSLGGARGLPTFNFHGRRYFKRVTLIIDNGVIEAALYPVFPPEQAAEQALRWLAEHPA